MTNQDRKARLDLALARIERAFGQIMKSRTTTKEMKPSLIIVREAAFLHTSAEMMLSILESAGFYKDEESNGHTDTPSEDIQGAP